MWSTKPFDKKSQSLVVCLSEDALGMLKLEYVVVLGLLKFKFCVYLPGISFSEWVFVNGFLSRSVG